MGRALFFLFLIVPLIEIALFIVIGQTIGLLPTLAGVLVTAMIGSFIIRRQGLSLFAEIQRLTGAGQLPAQQMAEGVMLAIAGALLLTPGYFTDLIGFLLLVPPLRAALYAELKKHVSVASYTSYSYSYGSGPDQGGGRINDPDVIDLDSDDWRGR